MNKKQPLEIHWKIGDILNWVHPQESWVFMHNCSLQRFSKKKDAEKFSKLLKEKLKNLGKLKPVSRNQVPDWYLKINDMMANSSLMSRIRKLAIKNGS